MRFRWHRNRCSFCKQSGHTWRDCPSAQAHARMESREDVRRDYIREEVAMGIRCGRCGARGHTRAECPRGRR